ncbi:GNAT family N-acetyltransferase [Enterococcus wangshanyuanii]|uniref:N-acetyltransferase n=1 Tax=Enterococcus wangshanyuanii TaxID=2005703 RepID=A0ABQ1NYF3_9ENTE|nr:GNAT family N-acetyltransferase [Enterococcus wangshanyuanii]GGC87651.1 N-acetyltransferase [Enterococcus wangshanyuanii]
MKNAITLHFYATADYLLYAQLSQDIRVMRYITEKAETDTEAAENFQKILDYNTAHNDHTGYYKVYDQSTYLGFAKLSWDEKKRIEIGYMLLPEYWGRGYAHQIITALLSKITQSNKLSQAVVYAIIDPNNGASRHLLQKHHFEAVWLGIEEGLPSEHLIWKP